MRQTILRVFLTVYLFGLLGLFLLNGLEVMVEVRKELTLNTSAIHLCLDVAKSREQSITQGWPGRLNTVYVGRMNDGVLLTYLVTVERMLNERPEAYVSAHLNDPRPVLPVDLMGMGSFQWLMPIDWAKFSMTKRFHLLQSLLPRLHNPRVWQCERGALCEGDIVAVIDTCCCRGMYPLGMVTYIGKSRTDGFPRNVDIKVAGKVLARPVHCRIPLVERSDQ